MAHFRDLEMESNFVESLPMDSLRAPGSYQVSDVVGSFVNPTPVGEPRLVGWSSFLADDFGLSRPSFGGEDLRLLAGNLVLPDMKPYAACYGGHQFGHWAGQLGDGRAITLAEIKDRKGQPWEFQLKGAGPTPYSRRADGRAVLRSSIREFICSEAMHFLGVPTTRALSVVTTGEPVIRDMFYDGNPKEEPGAIVCRVSPSFLRFGSFQMLAARQETELLRRLFQYVRKNFAPHLPEDDEKAVVIWFRDLTEKTARLMADWMRVGFVHGVMNTDNMSILGLTIDYGPYGWLDDYDPQWTPNTTDLPGRRYCYRRQPSIGLWNLAQLGNALLAAFPQQEGAFSDILESYQQTFQQRFLSDLAAKLGLREINLEHDEKLVVDLDRLLTESQADMTLFYRKLGAVKESELGVRIPTFLQSVLYREMSPELHTQWEAWFSIYSKAVQERGISDRQKSMERVNPLFVPRNYLTQVAIEAAEENDFSKVQELLEVLRNPYDVQKGREAFAALRPDWARVKPGCSTLSCSS